MAIIPGTPNSDNLLGTAGDDIMNQTGDALDVNGTRGNDIVDGREGNDVLYGGKGIDTLHGRSGADTLFGGSENDVLNGGSGNDALHGGSGNDALNGGDQSDVLNGNSGNDSLRGDSGNDSLNGGTGNDLLYGGSGADTQAGGSGNDTFDYNAVSESRPGLRDIILDFNGNGTSAGDRIDLRDIDANTLLPFNQAFTYIGNAQFHNVLGVYVPGELRYAGGILSGNTDTDAAVEFQIQLVGSPSLSVSGSNPDILL